MSRAKYFIAHLLTGDAHRYHRNLTKALSMRFGTAPLHEKVEPHITVKIPFEATLTELAGVEHVLAQFSSTQSSVPLTIKGFGRFGHRTIYLDAQHSRDAVSLVRTCIDELNTLPWMQQVPHEGNKLHASVARFLRPRQFRRIWRLVHTEMPTFQESLNSLSILKKLPGERSWREHRTFILREPSRLFSELVQSSYEEFHSQS